MSLKADETVVAGKVVTFHFTLTDEDGDVIDATEPDDAAVYLHGADNLVSGLEEALEGRHIGDTFEAVVPPEKGYGDYEGDEDDELIEIPLSEIPESEGLEIEPGMPVSAQGPDGEDVPLWVVDVDEETVFLDFWHPLAGVTLHFDIEVADIRDATAEELEHGHPHLDDDPA